MKKTIHIINTYHNTEARVRINAQGETYLSRSTVARVRRALCGIGGCMCGSILSERDPHSDWTFDAMPSGEVMVRVKE